LASLDSGRRVLPASRHRGTVPCIFDRHLIERRV
jgi:hypothetical protein